MEASGVITYRTVWTVIIIQHQTRRRLAQLAAQQRTQQNGATNQNAAQRANLYSVQNYEINLHAELFHCAVFCKSDRKSDG